jgi:hypothetical protein
MHDLSLNSSINTDILYDNKDYLIHRYKDNLISDEISRLKIQLTLKKQILFLFFNEKEELKI